MINKLEINLTSKIWNKSHFGHYLKNQIIIALLLTLVFSMFCFIVIPAFGFNRRAPHDREELDLFVFMMNHKVTILIAGALLGLLGSFVLKTMNDKPVIVKIESENNNFRIVTRRPELSTIKEYTGEFDGLKIIKDKVKLSPIDSAYIAYRFYSNKNYLGLFIPDHFVWAETPGRQIFNVLKKLKTKISDR